VVSGYLVCLCGYWFVDFLRSLVCWGAGYNGFERNDEARSCNHCCSGRAINNTYSERVFDLRYPACNSHAPYCHPWPVRLYNLFSHYLINCTIIEKNKLLDIKCVFCFSIQIFSETFLVVRRNKREIIWNVHRSPSKVPDILVVLAWKMSFL
jgi:hypothetical protein